MKLFVALVAFIALVGFSQALVIPKDAQPIELSSAKCEACRILDKFILEGENLSGFALKRYLGGKCKLAGPFRMECRMLIDSAVDYVEKYGHRLDANELCHKLMGVC